MEGTYSRPLSYSFTFRPAVPPPQALVRFLMSSRGACGSNLLSHPRPKTQKKEPAAGEDCKGEVVLSILEFEDALER